MSTTQQLLADLEALDALFSDESKWTRLVPARDSTGFETFARSARAVCWCLWGGIRAAGIRNNESMEAVLAGTAGLDPDDGIASWNDEPGRTFADVKKLIADTRARVAALEAL